MLSADEVLVLKLAYERQSLDGAALSRCLQLYRQGDRRSLTEILATEGQVAEGELRGLWEIAANAGRAKGAPPASRRDLEDELVGRQVLQRRRLDPATLIELREERRRREAQGRFPTLGDLLLERRLMDADALRAIEEEAEGRIATCVGCYTHLITQEPAAPGRHRCRRCGGTIYVGALPAEAREAIKNAARPGGSSPRKPAASSHLSARAPLGPSPLSTARRSPRGSSALAARPPTRRLSQQEAPPASLGVTPARPAQERERARLEELTRSAEGDASARFARFEILEEVGRGGMGVVYKVRAEGGALRALKVLLPRAPKQDDQEGRARRFKKEAALCQRLSHPHIPRLHEAGVHKGFPYLVFDYVEGSGLDEKLAREPMEATIAAQVARATARAVSHAHRVGVVHRDLKPSNIMITADGSPRLIDFGLAKSLDGALGLTQSGVSLGTPAYMSPEQARGDNRAIGPLTDVYALGAILYEMLTGAPPYQAENPIQLSHLIASGSLIRPSDRGSGVPAEIEAVCLKAMARAPEDRYEDAGAMARDLDNFLEGRPVRAHPRGGFWSSSAGLILGALLLAALIIGAALGWKAWRQAQAASQGRQSPR